MRDFFYKLMHETMAVGRAAGVEFPSDFAAELDRSVTAFPPTMKASMANDLDAGNRLELDWLAGKVVALGQSAAVCALAASPTSFDTGLAVLNTPHKKHHWHGSALGIGD